jgi:hypothetical protein
VQSTAIKTVDEYQAGLSRWQQQALARLREVIHQAAPEAVEKYKWAQPVYETRGPYVYMKAFKNTINLGYWRGVDLDDPTSELRGEGASMRHVVVSRTEDIDEEVLSALIRQACALNVQLGDPTKA